MVMTEHSRPDVSIHSPRGPYMDGINDVLHANSSRSSGNVQQYKSISLGWGTCGLWVNRVVLYPSTEVLHGWQSC